jgi:hypothetical protein
VKTKRSGVKRKARVCREKGVELGGFEPPTSWVRYKATLG